MKQSMTLIPIIHSGVQNNWCVEQTQNLFYIRWKHIYIYETFAPSTAYIDFAMVFFFLFFAVQCLFSSFKASP